MWSLKSCDKVNRQTYNYANMAYCVVTTFIDDQTYKRGGKALLDAACRLDYDCASTSHLRHCEKLTDPGKRQSSHLV